MTAAAIAAALAEVTYRPGWTFSLYEHPHEGPHLRIVAEVPNAYPPHDPTWLGINCPLPPMRDEAALAAWLSWRLQRVESHESREWLRFRGEVVSDPHAEPDVEYERRAVPA